MYMKQNVTSFWQKWAWELIGIALKFLKITPKSVKTLRKTLINIIMVGKDVKFSNDAEIF